MVHIAFDIPTWAFDAAMIALTISAALSAYKTMLEIKLRKLRK